MDTDIDATLRAHWALIKALLATHADLPALHGALAAAMSDEIERAGPHPEICKRLLDAEHRIHEWIQSENRKRSEPPK
jgi:hypothetical protein